jgi:hypothetical protein
VTPTIIGPYAKVAFFVSEIGFAKEVYFPTHRPGWNGSYPFPRSQFLKN